MTAVAIILKNRFIIRLNLTTILRSHQVSIVIPACPESKRSMIPDVAGMTIQTPRHYEVDTTLLKTSFFRQDVQDVQDVSKKTTGFLCLYPVYPVNPV